MSAARCCICGNDTTTDIEVDGFYYCVPCLVELARSMEKALWQIGQGSVQSFPNVRSIARNALAGA